MKRTLLILLLATFSIHFSWSQCVYTCSNYAVSEITYTTFPTGTTNLTPSFTNTFLGAWPDDGSTGPIPIGFSFDFYCNTYTAVHVCSNGFIMFDYMPFPWPTQYVHPTQSLPSSALPNGMVAFNMTDLDPGQGGTITYTTVGLAPNRMFIVTYSNVPCFTTPSNLNTGQIILYETSNLIEIHTTSAFPDSNQGTLGSSQGIENTTASDGKPAPGREMNNGWGGTASANTAYRWGPYTPTPPIQINGSNLLCQGALSNYSIVAMPGATGYNWSFPTGWIGSSTVTAVTTTAGAAGSISATATYSCGTSVATTLSVTVLPAPVITIVSTDPPVVCSGSNFTITPVGGLSYTLSPGGTVSNSIFILSAQSNTFYSIVGSDGNCNSFNTATTSILINPSPTISVNSGTICDGQQFTITPTGVGADSYNVTGGFLSVTPPVGTYSYQVIGNNTINGCSSMPVVSNLTVNANPSVTVTSVRSIICKGESVRLTASGATTYSWNTGLTTNTILVSPTITLQYTVTGTTAEGCSKAKTINLIVAPCTGIEDLNGHASGISVFPNPSNGSFNLQLTNAGDNTSIEIYDALGKLILSQNTVKQNNHLSLADQPNGLYYIKVKNSSTQETLKIIKE